MKYNEDIPVSDLLYQVAADSETAFRHLYNRYRDKVYTLGMHLTRSEHLAEEIVQEVFIKVWLKRTELQQISYFNSWIRTIARNTCIDFLRRMEVESNALASLAAKPGGDNNFTENDVVSREYDRLLLDAIRQLPPQRQKIYLLSRQQGLKQEEIAKQLGISVHTVKEHIKIARKFIHAYLEKRIDLAVFLVFAVPAGSHCHLHELVSLLS